MHDSLAQALRDWQNFYLLTGGAAATLAGLLYLAIQFGVGTEVRYPAGVISALHTFVAPTFLRFVAVLFIAALALMPSETSQALGTLLLLPAIAGVWSTWDVIRRSRREYPAAELAPDHWIWNVLVPAATNVLLVVVSLSLARQLPWALTALGAVTITLLVTALFNTWQMMTWLARRHILPQEQATSSLKNGRPE